jgi:hypothetical protein
LARGTDVTDEAEITAPGDEDWTWYLIVLPELGAHARTVVHYAGPLDDELKQCGLGHVFSFGTRQNRTQHSIDIKVKDPERGLAVTRRILRTLNVPASASICGKVREFSVYDDAT